MQVSVLQTVRLPARLTAEQAGELLGFAVYELPVLMRHGLLKPLGRPAPNGHKYFASADVLERCNDVKWLARATQVLAETWKTKNHVASVEAA